MRIHPFSGGLATASLMLCGLFITPAAFGSNESQVEQHDIAAQVEMSDAQSPSPLAGEGLGRGGDPPQPQTSKQSSASIEHLDAGDQIGRRHEVHGLIASDSTMHEMDMSSMQGGNAPSDARDPDYSDGHDHGPMTGMDMQDNASRGMLLIDRLEYFNARESNGQAFEGQAWFGNDRDKLWIRAEGERSDGALEHLRSELLWDQAVSAYWDTQLGVRHDFGIGPDRSWAAFGVQGLAPYWFEVSATAYVGQAGRTAFRAEAEYELLLTQRLIVQPRFEANFYGRNDPQRGIGSGLSDAALGVRLRYEVRREFAPYIGIEWIRKFGDSADYARTALEPVFDRQIVAGIHFWL